MFSSNTYLRAWLFEYVQMKYWEGNTNYYYHLIYFTRGLWHGVQSISLWKIITGHAKSTEVPLIHAPFRHFVGGVQSCDQGHRTWPEYSGHVRCPWSQDCTYQFSKIGYTSIKMYCESDVRSTSADVVLYKACSNIRYCYNVTRLCEMLFDTH